jgi:hypothetical protein
MLNQVTPIARDIARRCRQSSITRKYLREFELHRDNALDRAKLIARGGLTRAAQKPQKEAIFKAFTAMEKIVRRECYLRVPPRAEVPASALFHSPGKSRGLRSFALANRELPARPDEVACVPARISQEIVLMFRFGFPKVA